MGLNPADDNWLSPPPTAEQVGEHQRAKDELASRTVRVHGADIGKLKIGMRITAIDRAMSFVLVSE